MKMFSVEAEYKYSPKFPDQNTLYNSLRPQKDSVLQN